MEYAVIMAGGVGSRFWPLSRTKNPKQLLALFGERSMIQATVDRILPMIPPERILIVTNVAQGEAIRQQLPEIPGENILAEPVGRNTAPCIGLAAMHIRERHPDAVMIVLAADHLVRDEQRFREQLAFGVHCARQTGGSITLGIRPTRPETGYGYIQYLPDDGIQDGVHKAFSVKAFTEKPDRQTAVRFIAAGDFLWNSGIFIWKVEELLGLLNAYLPDIYQGLETISRHIGTETYAQILSEAYTAMQSISIDYGVMEKTKPVYVIPGDFGWSDAGSWDEVYLQSAHDDRGNVAGENIILINTTNSFFRSRRPIAAVGVEDIIVVETEDALLICRRGQSQDVKKIVDELEKQKRTDLL